MNSAFAGRWATIVALGFILTVDGNSTASLWLLYALSAVLMFASPFFTSGRSAILPTVATGEELHTANSITQTTGWATLAIGAFAAGAIVSNHNKSAAGVKVHSSVKAGALTANHNQAGNSRR